MKMTKKNISEYCLRNGVLVYEKYDEKDRRKRFYRMSIPTSNYDYIVKRPVDCYDYVNKLLEDDKFRHNVEKWVRTWAGYEI